MEDSQALYKTIRRNRLMLSLSRHWLIIALGILFMYVGLSVLPPFLMRAGYDGAANVIYKIYSPMCHQFAFRSWFLFGDQHTYPRAVAGSDQHPFEEYAVRDPHFADINVAEWSASLQLASRSFKGNEEMGYKAALCERDVAIYGMMLLAGMAFGLVRKRLRPAPIWLYLIVGLVPIGLDGFSQLISYPPFEFWPIRETLPAYRILTGSLFGMMNIWLAFPYLEQSMREAVDAFEMRLEMAQRRLALLPFEE